MSPNENSTDTSTSQPRMIDIIAAELQELQDNSLKFRNKRTNAKTSAKQSYFDKKLKKNNKKMMNMLVAFEQMRGRQVDTSMGAENIPEPEAPEIPSEDE